MPLAKSQRLGAQAADGARVRFPASRRPPRYSAVRRGPGRGAARGAAPRVRRSRQRLLHLGRLARRRHVDGLFEERPFQRIGLVEDGERLELAGGHQAFDGELAAGDVALHLQMPLAQILPMRRNAAANSSGSLARITPRLAERPSGFSTHGYGAVAPVRADRRPAPRGRTRARAFPRPGRVGAPGTYRGRRARPPADETGCPASRPPRRPAPRDGRPPPPRHRTCSRAAHPRDSAMRSNFTGNARSPQGSSSTWQRSVARVRSTSQPPRRIGENADLVAGGGGEEEQRWPLHLRFARGLARSGVKCVS